MSAPATTSPTAPPARWWHPLENKKVVCRLCPRECHIPLGSRGFCFVRANVDGQLQLTTYGRSSGFCIDPIEKKPLNHFLPGTPVLSFGTAGCNLGCKFCQNWDISKSREMDTLAQFALPEAIVEAALRTGCRSLAFTYNDPVIWAEYAIDIAKVARARGLKTVAVTAGYISHEARGEFYDHMDAANVDIKAFTDFFYTKLCQVNLEPILDTLKFLKRETNVWFELTNLMIPGENDSAEETKKMCGWIVEHLGPDVPIHFTAFHPDFKMRDHPPTPPETLVHARALALAAGIRYAFVGNVNDVAHQSTYCHACGKLLIQRDWYELGAYHLKGNTCSFCGTVIPGVFDAAGPGAWGRKRQPIAIGEPSTPLIRIHTPVNKNFSSPVSPVTPAPASASASAPQIEFTAEQDTQLLAFARAVIESTLREELFCSARLPDPLKDAPAYGIFVSLHRGKQLRSCKGQWGGPSASALSPLGQLLGSVARDAATNDPRFPRIALAELPFLELEISLMHSPQVMTAHGTDRLAQVQVGTHGLVILHPAGNGLLLPHVATEQNWDAPTFLEQICLKAGLPPGTWRSDQAKLMTFRARKLTAPALAAEINLAQVGGEGLSQLFACIQQILTGTAPTPPDPAHFPALHRTHPEELGLCLQTSGGVAGTSIAAGASLLTLAQNAARSLADTLQQRGLAEPVHQMILLTAPQQLAGGDYPHRFQHLPNIATLAQADGRWSLALPQPNTQTNTIAQALAALQLSPAQWQQDRANRIRVTAFHTLRCQAPAQPAPAPAFAQRPVENSIRPPFRAGTFYPANPAQILSEVDGFLRAGGLHQTHPQSFRAIMLPHAGWRFCGSTMGKTLAAVKLPQTAIILGPRHTPLGANSSVSSHAAWQIPGTAVPVDTALAQRLARNVPGLACESEAHRQEHGTEVLLPFLLRLRPDLHIVPIVLGQMNADAIAALARELANLRADALSRGDEPPLLIISSDMNHFAPDAEGRRRDRLALDALQTGNPRHLYDTCVKNDISMCGLLPAVVVLQALLHETPAISPRLIDYTTSAAASGDTSSVVGYAGVVIP